MDAEKAAMFAAALTELCHRHGVMVWTGVQTVPIMVSDVHPNDAFHYDADSSAETGSVVIRRVLS
jgi:hypothetical protein